MADTAQNLVVPALGESITEATVARWLKKVGEQVALDETLVELETDKVTLEVNSPTAGKLTDIIKGEGEVVTVGETLGHVEAGEVTASAEMKEPALEPKTVESPIQLQQSKEKSEATLSPAVRKIIEDNRLNPTEISATGKGGRITKEDVQKFLSSGSQQESSRTTVEMEIPANQPSATQTLVKPTSQASVAPSEGVSLEREERVQMTRLRQTIAKRLKDAQNTAAMLTSFNEVDMSKIMDLRTRVRDSFEKKHGVRLGFMSFFVKACLVALKEIPAVNAEVDGSEIVYKNFYDIGVAVSTPQGLVVPVVREVDRKDFATIEADINQLAERARNGQLSVDDLTGGTFTITNGGVFGSLLSTPIINPPQSAILGMHKIEKRAVVVNDEVQVRPMMYIALTYDHRIIDGREAVSFLVRVKECIEDPERILLDV